MNESQTVVDGHEHHQRRLWIEVHTNHIASLSKNHALGDHHYKEAVKHANKAVAEFNKSFNYSGLGTALPASSTGEYRG